MNVYEKLTLYFIGMAVMQLHTVKYIEQKYIFGIITNFIMLIIFTIMFIVTIVKYYKSKK